MNPELQNHILKAKIGADFDKIDVSAHLDSSLSLSENIDEFKNKFPLLFEQEINLPELLMLEAKGIEEQELHDIKAEVNRIKSLPDVSSFYGSLKDKINMIKQGLENVLIVQSNCGLGKTTQIEKELPDNSVIISGHYSPRRFYSKLYENRDNKIIFMDDMEELLENKIILCILKQGLDSRTKRTITWDSTIGKIDELPSSFNLNSRIILAINNIPKDKGFEAILDRSLKHEIKISNIEIIALMRKISPESSEIIEYIEDNSDESVNLNLRTLYHSIKYFEYDKSKWRELVKEMLGKEQNKILKILLEIEKENMSVKDKIKLFNGRTGLNRSSYFSYKNRIR